MSEFDKSIIDLESLQSEIWDVIKSRKDYDPSLHAIYDRLQKIIEALKEVRK